MKELSHDVSLDLLKYGNPTLISENLESIPREPPRHPLRDHDADTCREWPNLPDKNKNHGFWSFGMSYFLLLVCPSPYIFMQIIFFTFSARVLFFWDVKPNQSEPRSRMKPNEIELEEDEIIVPCDADEPGPGIGLSPADENHRLNRLFPNAFKVAGVKHICDNLLSSTLHSLPQHLRVSFLPKF